MQTKKILPVLACALFSSPALALDISFFNYEGNDFFTQDWLDTLEQAARVYEGYIKDDLNVRVNLGSASLGYPAEGGATISYDTSFRHDWEGEITFDDTTNWYFGTSESFSGYDVFTVALHELGHVLGIGLVDTWAKWVDESYFTGANAMNAYGGPVPLYYSDHNGLYDHWLGGTMSALPVTGTLQLSVFNPSISGGERRYLTELDLAGLKDIGWDVSVVPEPETLYMLLAGLGIVGLVARRHRRAA